MIAELLRSGSQDAITGAELCAATGLSDRAMRNRVNRERKEGALILGNDRGYYLAASNSECAEYIARKEKGLRKQLATLKIIRDRSKVPDDQRSLRL